MRFICTQENLLQGLARVTPLAGKDAQLAALSHVLCRVREGILELTCTDLEVGAQVTVPGKVESEGGCTVLARTLFDYVQQLPATHPVSLVIKKAGLEVATGDFQAQFPTGEIDEFPLLPTVSQVTAVRISGERLGAALSGVIYAAARDLTRPEIHSVFITGKGKEVWFAATDSFRLSEEIIPLEHEVGGFSFLLPLAAAHEVARLFTDQSEVVILPQESHVTFQGEGVEFTSRLVEGKYPDYRQIIPQQHTVEGVVEREVFARALKTLSVFLPRDSKRVQCQFSPEQDQLHLRVVGDRGEGAVAVPFQGEGSTSEVYFNIQYLLDGVQHLTTTKCKIQSGGESAPAVFSPLEEGRRSLYVVMPIQA